MNDYLQSHNGSMPERRIIKLSDVILPAYKEFWNTKKTYVICKGSRGSGKSKHAALWHIYTMMKYPLSNTLVVRKVERTLRDSCFSDLKWAIHQLGVDNYWNCTTSPLEMTYKLTGQKILFRGLDDGYKITSISVPKGVLNFLWFEEFYEITKEDDFDILDESIRGQLPEGYWKRVTATFNPWSEKHFSKRRFFDNPVEDVLSMTTTYLDNPYLSETDVQLFETMKKNNPRRYQVAGLGNWGIVDGLIYENWREEAFSLDNIRQCKSAFGLDFGYTNDPSAFFAGFVDIQNKKLYVWDEFYEKGLSNKRIFEKITSMGYVKERITADSAEPKSIDELKTLGIRRIDGAKKGKDSIANGIQWIQDLEIIIHPRCVNFLTEISNYTWDEDKFGKKLNVPIDDFNHLMDAMRYALEQYITGDKWIY